jgi:hypothetical protein
MSGAWRGSGSEQDHYRPPETLFNTSCRCCMATSQPNGQPGRSESGTQRFSAVIRREKTRWCLGVHLASVIGGYAISSNMNANAEVNKTIPRQYMSHPGK